MNIHANPGCQLVVCSAFFLRSLCALEVSYRRNSKRLRSMKNNVLDMITFTKRTIKHHYLYVISMQSWSIELLNVEVKCDRIEERNNNIKNHMNIVISAVYQSIFSIIAQKTEMQPNKA